MNIKKLFAVLAGVSMLATQLIPAGALAATYSQELTDAYNWAYSKGVTTMSPIDNANMYGAITRSEMAKMLSVYATEVLGMTPDTSAACTFSDIDSVKGDLHDYIIESCELGIMGQGITAFRPYDTISRAEFGTALSRVLWGNQYEGGTPYYAKHLDALKAAGIMTQIANAESTKEVRGYVMLMLMRSEGSDAVVDCDDPMTVIACTTDTDACPAKCRESDEPTIVKAGDLAVTAKAAEGRKALVATGGAVSDLDTLTFKTSEDVTITKVVLERYGYSSANDVDEVRLEDQDGNVIAEPKSLSKDKVTLSIKKDYRSVDGTYVATIVARLTGENVGGTIGFKVVDVDSSAKNLNLDDYTPYTYDMVTYAGNTVTVDIKGTPKNYNYEEGESYEIARLRVKAGQSIIYVKGFTLTNGGNLDMADFLDKLTVTADGKDVKGVKYSVNKDEELVISFDEMTIEMNKSALFIISASFEDFDDYGHDVAYYMAKDSDINAVEKKTGARLTVDGAHAQGDAISHAFNGGKIKLANTKLGKVDAAQGSEGVLVAEGTVTVTEPISKIGFTVDAVNAYVVALRMFVNGDEYEGKKSGTEFTFSNVEIAESGKVQFKVDIDDNDNASGSFTIAPAFNKVAFSGARYDNSRDSVKSGDVAGSISFSQVTIQSARATLKNTLEDDAQFMLNETSDPNLVFDGTYTAKKALINLNKFYIDGTKPTGFDHEVTFYLFVDGTEVASSDSIGSGAEEWFTDVKVEAGESVNVKVKAVVDAYGVYTGTWTGLNLVLRGTDEFDKDVQDKSAELVGLKVAEKGSVKVETAAAKDTVLRTSLNEVLAEFTVKSSNGDAADLTDLVFTIEGTGTSFDDFTGSDIDISVVDDFEDDCVLDAGVVTCSELKVSLPKTVTISFNAKKRGAYVLTLNSVNDKPQTRSFSKRFEKALVYIKAQDNGESGATTFTLGVNGETDVEVSNVAISVSGTYLDGTYAKIPGTFTDGDELIVENTDKIQFIDGIKYHWELDGATGDVEILKSTYKDYFKLGDGQYARVAKND